MVSITLGAFTFPCFPSYPFKLLRPRSHIQLNFFSVVPDLVLNPRPSLVSWTVVNRTNRLPPRLPKRLQPQKIIVGNNGVGENARQDNITERPEDYNPERSIDYIRTSGKMPQVVLQHRKSILGCNQGNSLQIMKEREHIYAFLRGLIEKLFDFCTKSSTQAGVLCITVKISYWLTKCGRKDLHFNIEFWQLPGHWCELLRFSVHSPHKQLITNLLCSRNAGVSLRKEPLFFPHMLHTQLTQFPAILPDTRQS